MASNIDEMEVNWFHGSLSRELAEVTLMKSGIDGSFLVRDCASSPGDYVLSVLCRNTVHHIQILRHENDAFFSIDEENRNVIHGLDELIKRYFQMEYFISNNERIYLRTPMISMPPPPDCKRHGRDNLLHRTAAATGTKDSVDVVRAMVSTTHRNLEAKNAEGKTAVHLAAQHANNEVLQILIGAKCNVNSKDLSNSTPLHYACMMNHHETVEILMNPFSYPQSENGALPYYRRDRDWVPLHDAAARGHVECVRILLKNYHVALRPRTLEDELPIDLAREGNHAETVEMLENYRPPESRWSEKDWYHDNVPRPEAAHRLAKIQEEYDDPSKGFFLIRYSEHQAANVLTLLYLRSQPNYTHYPILKTGRYFHFDNGPYFESMLELIDHYSRWKDGLPTTLHIPVSPSKFLPSTVPLLPPPLPRRTPKPSKNNRFVPLPSDNLSSNINNNKENGNPSGSVNFLTEDNIPSDWIVLGRALGEGEFGMVNEAKLVIPGQPPLEVAVKRLNSDLHEDAKEEFIREAALMLSLNHEHVVKLIGFSWDDETYMIQEMMKLGSLRDYLITNRDDICSDINIRLWAYQICKGMCYLETKNLVHRDLATRNILLANPSLAKISDFGLSRCLGSEDYYTASKGGRWPVKWYAPESCTRAIFNHQSDVWSFGVTLWEMYSLGEPPFPDLEGKEVVELIIRGNRLEKPELASDEVYNVMLKCWDKIPEGRITFQNLLIFFSSSDV